jgi:hypothetical protein
LSKKSIKKPNEGTDVLLMTKINKWEEGNNERKKKKKKMRKKHNER